MSTWTVCDALNQEHEIEADYIGESARGYVNLFRRDEPNMQIVASFFRPVSVRKKERGEADLAEAYEGLAMMVQHAENAGWHNVTIMGGRLIQSGDSYYTVTLTEQARDRIPGQAFFPDQEES